MLGNHHHQRIAEQIRREFPEIDEPKAERLVAIFIEGLIKIFSEAEERGRR